MEADGETDREEATGDTERDSGVGSSDGWSLGSPDAPECFVSHRKVVSAEALARKRWS